MLTAPLRLGSLCTGYGGLDLGVGQVLDVEHVWYAEHDPATTKTGKPVSQYAAQVCAAHWPDVPNLGDLAVADWESVEPVDILTAGFPCQDVSAAGNRAGIKPGTRSGLWRHIAYAISVLRPRVVVLENVEGLLSAPADSNVEPCPWCLGDIPPDLVVRAFGVVLADLSDLGFDAEWATVPASDVGAPHRRRRVFILAWPQGSPPDAGQLVGRVGVDSVTSDGLTLLPTPRATDGTKGGPNQRGSSGDLMLPSAVVQLLPTPTVNDSRGGRNATANRSNVKPATNHDGWTLSDVAYADRWGEYGPAIARWEAVTGRSAPEPTELGSKGQPRLSPRFVEWLMGLPAGWVTDLLPRNAALRVLGNGVVPAQAAAAVSSLVGGGFHG